MVRGFIQMKREYKKFNPSFEIFLSSKGILLIKMVIIFILYLIPNFAFAGFLSSIEKSIKKGRTSLECSIGKKTKESLIQEFGIYENPKAKYMVENIGRRISALSNRQEVAYDFTVLNTPEVNAFAAPGGFVFVTRGLLEKVEDENQLAFVIGHEIGHITRKHSIKAMERGLGASLLLTIFLGGDAGSKEQIAGIVSSLLFLKRSRKNEFEADWQGVHLSRRAGFNPYGGNGFFKVLSKMEGKGMGNFEKVASFFSTHPPTKDRISRATEHIMSLSSK